MARSAEVPLAVVAVSILASAVLVFSGDARLPEVRAGPQPDWVSVDNGVIRVGVDKNRGGSITYLSASSSNTSVINYHDMGREVQLSFYSGPQYYEPSAGSQKCNTTWRHGDWPWNPIGAGDVDGNSGNVLAVQKNDTTKTIHVQSRPLQWACDEVPCECSFEKWIELNGTAAVVTAQLTNSRSDHTDYGAYGQELPAIYTVGSLYQVVAYNGTKPFTNGSLTHYPLQQPQGILATEHWAALVNKDGWGLGVFQPGTIHITGGFFGTPDPDSKPTDDATGYLGPYHQEILDWNIVYRYRFHLVLGDLATIRSYAYQSRGAIENCMDVQFTDNRQHWISVNANGSAMPQGHWHVEMTQNDPQLIGPNCLWQAADHPMLYINASYSTTQTSTYAEVYFNVAGLGQRFDEEHSVVFSIMADGNYHMMEVDLSKSLSYTGSIFGLRFDPVSTGTSGSYVNIASITVK